MKKIQFIAFVLLAGVIAGVTTPAMAEVSIRWSSGNWNGAYRDHDRRVPYYPGYYRPVRSSWRNPWARPYRTVAVAPLVVQQPVYVPVPVETPPPAYSSLSGDYGRDLGSFRERLTRLRTVAQRQKEKGSITVSQYDRFMAELDGIDHDQRVRAYDRGGNLASEDFAELTRRLDQTDEDMERALTE